MRSPIGVSSPSPPLPPCGGAAVGDGVRDGTCDDMRHSAARGHGSGSSGACVSVAIASAVGARDGTNAGGALDGSPSHVHAESYRVVLARPATLQRLSLKTA